MGQSVLFLCFLQLLVKLLKLRVLLLELAFEAQLMGFGLLEIMFSLVLVKSQHVLHLAVLLD